MLPSQAPSALAVLRVEWFSAAASDWPSSATSISRVWIIGTITLGRKPSRNTATIAVGSQATAVPNSASSTAIAASESAIPRSSPYAASLPAMMLPTVIPTP